MAVDAPAAGGAAAGVKAHAPTLAALATNGARQYARMQGLAASAVLPFTAVTTQTEKDKVERDWPMFMRTDVCCFGSCSEGFASL